MQGVGREGGGGRGVEGREGGQPGRRGRGQLEEAAVVRGPTLVAVGQRVDGCGGGPVGRVAADRVGPAAGEVDALSLQCRTTFWWVDFPERKGTFHPKFNRKANFKYRLSPSELWRWRPHLCFHVNCQSKCRLYLANLSFAPLQQIREVRFSLFFFYGWKEEIPLVASWKKSSVPASRAEQLDAGSCCCC